jgi:hypothetical protein
MKRKGVSISIIHLHPSWSILYHLGITQIFIGSRVKLPSNPWSAMTIMKNWLGNKMSVQPNSDSIHGGQIPR